MTVSQNRNYGYQPIGGEHGYIYFDFKRSIFIVVLIIIAILAFMNNVVVSPHDEAEIGNLVFVVSHCKESLATLTSIVGNETVYIYHKCDLTYGNEKWNHITLPNVGREGHSYLHWMKNHYVKGKKKDRLYVFLQAGSEPGDSKITRTIEKMNKNSNILFSNLGHVTKNLPWFDGIPTEQNNCLSKESFCHLVKEHTGGNCKDTVFTYRGEFVTRGRAIDSFLRTHENFVDELYEKISKHNNPCWGHYLERLWGPLFNKEDTIPVEF